MCSDTTMTFQHLEVKKIYASILKEVKTIIKKYFFLEKYIDSYIENKTFFEEGTGGLVEYKGSVIQIIDDLVNGTRRSMWYQGVNSIPELQKKAIAVKTSSNTNAENMPRI